MSNTVTNFNIDAIRNIASSLAFDGSQSLLVSLTQETIDARIEETLLSRFGQSVLLLPGESVTISALTSISNIDPEVSLTWAEYW